MTKETYIKELDKILKQVIVIGELEDIKSEIQEEILNNQGYITYRNGLTHCYEIIDKHIEKLKGDK